MSGDWWGHAQHVPHPANRMHGASPLALSTLSPYPSHTLTHTMSASRLVAGVARQGPQLTRQQGAAAHLVRHASGGGGYNEPTGEWALSQAQVDEKPNSQLSSSLQAVSLEKRWVHRTVRHVCATHARMSLPATGGRKEASKGGLGGSVDVRNVWRNGIWRRPPLVQAGHKVRERGGCDCAHRS